MSDKPIFKPDNRQFCCESCRQEAKAWRTYMIGCPKCGNKRCPKADYHGFKCTGSNDVGQQGELE